MLPKMIWQIMLGVFLSDSEVVIRTGSTGEGGGADMMGVAYKWSRAEVEKYWHERGKNGGGL